MKRLAAFAAILAIIALQTSALADDFIEPAQYIGYDEYKAKVNANGSCAVFITMDSNGSIVYADQVSDAFSGAIDFLLTSNKSTDLCMSRLQNSATVYLSDDVVSSSLLGGDRYE